MGKLMEAVDSTLFFQILFLSDLEEKKNCSLFIQDYTCTLVKV